MVIQQFCPTLPIFSSFQTLSKSKTHLIGDFEKALTSNFYSENCRIQEYSDESGKNIGMYCPQISLEARLSYLIKWRTPQLIAVGFIDKVIAEVVANIQNDNGHLYDLLNLLEQVKLDQELKLNFESLIVNAKGPFLKNIDDIDDFGKTIRFAKLFDNLSPQEMTSLSEKFENELQGLIDQLFSDTDPGYIDDQIFTLRKISDYLGIDISENLVEIDEYLEKLENQINDQIDPLDDEIKSDVDFEAFDIDNMFGLLLDLDQNNAHD